MTQHLWVTGPLPGMNELVAAAKSGRGKGNAYSRLKAKWTNDVALMCRAQRLKPVERAHVRFIWHEANKRRDPDNLSAASKLILDGLVLAKVLGDDGWDEVVGFTHAWVVDGKVGCEVSIFSSPGGQE